MVRERGVEPLHPRVLDPKSSASTSSATLAGGMYCLAFQAPCQGSTVNITLKSLLKFLYETPDEAFVGKTVIGVMPYDHVIEDLNH